MKLFSISNALGLASLYCTLTSAKITMEPLPSVVKVGDWHEVKWTSDRAYVSHAHPSASRCRPNITPQHVKDLRIMHWDEWKLSERPTDQMLDHYLQMKAGDSSEGWKVPDLEPWCVQLQPADFETKHKLANASQSQTL